MDLIKQLEAITQSHFDFGYSFNEHTHEECGFSSTPQHGDIVIYYDWNDDYMPDAESNSLIDLQEEIEHKLQALLNAHGYELVEDNDGSGNGLYYCASLYRKVR